MQGLIVEQSSGNFLRLDQYSDGSQTRLFVARFTNGIPTVAYSVVIPPSTGSFYLRLARQGDPLDRIVFVRWGDLVGDSWPFSRGISVQAVGVFAGNAGPSPAFTGIVDYFHDRSNPVVGPSVQSVAVSDSLLSDADAGVDAFSVSVVFDAAMDPAVAPVTKLALPNAGPAR